MKNLVWIIIICGCALSLTARNAGAVITTDTSAAVINLSGNVPAVFSVTARGYPGDLDLSPNVYVFNRVLGILHFQYNENVASIFLASSTASGMPENSGATAYPFATAITYSPYSTGCVTIDSTAGLAMTAASIESGAGSPVNIASAIAKALSGNTPANTGVNEDCILTASWVGASTSGGALPIADTYSETLTVTMTAN